jgi:2-amino-4-hydroxy-6-hydroxymethyldihydropteridine diphosphokinase
MVSAIIALGGNVGDVRATFKAAIIDVCAQAQARLLARSSDYATPPWGEEQQPPFVNACIEIETALAPGALLGALQAVERTFGRDRTKERRWGPRTLDLDLIAYDDLTLRTEALTLPHPHVLERAFVLVPLAEIAPERKIGGRSVEAALADVSSAGIERLPPLD